MPYHHGNLRSALVDAAMELARHGGPGAVGLRAVSRQAGVSHNAAYRHFADRDHLLGEVCTRAMAELAQRMETRLAAVGPRPDPAAEARARLEAAGRAYVDFALAEPGWFRTAFGVPRSLDPGRAGAGGDPYAILNALLDRLVSSGALPAARRAGAEYAAWAAVHGLATLELDGPLRDLPASERTLALDRVVAVVLAGL